MVPITSETTQYTNHIIGFSNTTTPVPTSLDSFDVTGTDVTGEVEFTTHFYGGEQLSHVSLSADLPLRQYPTCKQQGQGPPTSVMTLDSESERKAGKPAITSSVTSNDGVEVSDDSPHDRQQSGRQDSTLVIGLPHQCLVERY